ncbi:MAG: VIT1/CCC1 transporter family protein [Kiritimatiellales bacterium]|nr:VIT1/CCC1 transporter family protein [Kiritimatiellales bacterium]MCF7863381.1 VIT1/CCC1 transporter family protein [Kiritimatiellales bacterium]
MKTKLQRHEQTVLTYQQNEITEHHIYLRLARMVKNDANRAILENIAKDELRHYHEWKVHTGRDIAPRKISILTYALIGKLFGFTFAIKLMEKGEASAQVNYGKVLDEVGMSRSIIEDEQLHEEELIGMLDEERLRYIGSIVLGLNDALVELTGALAGLTLALQNTKLIALTGSITGLAAALSMATSEYLSTKSEPHGQNPLKASIYTGSTYVTTVILLILPYLIFDNFYVCLSVALGTGILIIAAFNYYISVAQEVPFRKRFLEMAGLSLGVSAISFLIGWALRAFTGIEV